MNAIQLKTEYLRDPIGIDITVPRLFWNCAGGVTQTAYQLVCRDESGEILWDSGKVESPSMRVIYGGAPLGSRIRVEWSVRLWDENGQLGEWSETARFELGLLNSADWTARWIAGDYSVDKKLRYPVDCFRKTFAAGQVKKARLYAAACGVYEGRLNGKRIGNFVLAPGHTDYRKRVQYQTYDVTGLLQEGSNELSFQLADGWYRGSCGAWGAKNQYGTQTKLLAQLELTLTDGTVQTIATDGSWEWSNDGPIRFADNQDGEVVEAWRTPSYARRARVTEHPVVPSASDNVPVTEHERLKPALVTTPTGKTVLDFGQNIAGYVEFTLTTQKGQRVFLRFGEMLNESGEFTQKNIQCSNKKITTPLQKVEYFCKDGRNKYKTTFAISGFQYVLVETGVTWKPEDFTAIAVYSDLETTARFESSNPLLDKLVDATLWSAKNNSADVPTDCPTRERHGWTGDAQIFCTTASYLQNYIPFAKKYIRDMADTQKENGCVAQICPNGGVDSYMNVMDGSPGWSDAIILMPWRLARQFGDGDILRENYPIMKRYANFLMDRCGKWYPTATPTGVKGEVKRFLVNCGQSYGEWAEPADVYPNRWTDMVSPHPEVSTAYTAHVLGVMAEIAEELGKENDAKVYRSYAKNCTAAYQALRKTKKFPLDTDRQADLVRPLYFGLLDEEQTDYAKKRLIEALERYGWRVGTGFLSTPLILYVLADIDIEYAYRLLENEEMPGWLFMPKSGATTIWESWEGTSAQGGIASLDHYSKGAVCQWMFDTMCGVKIAGENHFAIAPRPGGHFTHAGLSYDSVYGTVESRWECKDGKTVYTVTIPANCTAEVALPGGTAKTVGTGSYTFEEADP